MIEDLNQALNDYFSKWQHLQDGRKDTGFFKSLKPVAVGWKVLNRDDYDAIVAELHEKADKVVETWMNERWIAKVHLKDVALTGNIEIIKIMQRRPGSEDAVGLDHLDFYTPEFSRAEQVLKAESDLKWSWESNTVRDGYDWLSVWFDSTEAKIKSDTVLDIVAAELQDFKQEDHRQELMITPIFITGNEHKAKQLNDWLGIEISHQKVELDEIQALDLQEVVEHKARQAYDIVKQPVLVEDVAMVFTAFKQLPGPFIKWFEAGSGLETMCHMLDGFDDRSAEAHTMYGLYDGFELHVFDGIMRGAIARVPQGTNGFGFDSIFINEGQTRTRAELDAETYGNTSYRQEALAKLREYLQKT